MRDALDRLNALPGQRGYVTEVFCEKSRYFQPKNGTRIDAIRDAIERDYAGSRLYPVLLTALMLAADRVDSTTGVQMAYLKQWAPRAYNDLELRVPALLVGPGLALLGEAADVVDEVGDVDLAYLDPPYNQHSYRANYHVWETLIRWDDPPHYGVACKRADIRDPGAKSPFNRRAGHALGPAPDHRAGAGPHPDRLVQRRILGGPRRHPALAFGRRPSRTYACWPSTPSATWARRSASTIRAVARWDRCPTCATSSTCSSPGPRPPSRPRATPCPPEPPAQPGVKPPAPLRVPSPGERRPARAGRWQTFEDGVVSDCVLTLVSPDGRLEAHGVQCVTPPNRDVSNSDSASSSGTCGG